ncbi:ammonium transporter, partial [Bacillus pumilus]
LLVWLMTPGIALFYGGLLRSKKVLSTNMHSLTSLAIVSIVWIMLGYSLAFAPGNSWIGCLDWIGLKGVGFERGSYSETSPHSFFMMFQMTFA